MLINFAPHTAPSVGIIVSLYRDGAKIGEVKLTEPRRGSRVAGDILRGEPQVGDVAR